MLIFILKQNTDFQNVNKLTTLINFADEKTKTKGNKETC